MIAGFADVDITPPLGTQKIGWIRQIVSDTVLDTIHARIAVLESGEQKLAIVQLDTLSLGWNEVNDMRRRIAQAHAFPGEHIMVTATHNLSPPVLEGYLEYLSQGWFLT